MSVLLVNDSPKPLSSFLRNGFHRHVKSELSEDGENHQVFGNILDCCFCDSREKKRESER